ncbi:tail fiber domain-containing protein [Filimonas effusa]|uniref:Tail fiber domain-containing protein n=1 Tax=Filimonas effusa TaxID=2508721 RepID=A0A4Q1DAY3_9BACT|nr:tail fiber domain-containing protein [Filimonas effusa]RXK86582.1 tail fiber domain-containing protein [Filimonas effusa]
MREAYGIIGGKKMPSKWLYTLLLSANVTIVMLCMAPAASAQVKLGNNITQRDSSAALEIESQRQVLLLPRINDTNTIVTTVKDGALIYYNNVPGGGLRKGLYLRSNNYWNYLPASGASPSWNTTGNTGTDGGQHFLGTTDNRSLLFKTNNITRMVMDGTTGYTGIGTLTPSATLHNAGSTVLEERLLSNFASDAAIGTAANTVDSFTLFRIPQNTAGRILTLPAPTNNVPGRIVCMVNSGTAGFTMAGIAIPASAAIMFIWNGTSWRPVADGIASASFSLSYQYRQPTTLGIGTEAMFFGAGDNNVALGYTALRNINTTGTNNVGIGQSPLNVGAEGSVVLGSSVATGSYKVAIGGQALYNGGGIECVGVGKFNIPGTSKANTAIGPVALYYSVSGANNTAAGYRACISGNTASSNLTALGWYCMTDSRGAGMTAMGAAAFDPSLGNSHPYCSALGYKAFFNDGVVSSSSGSSSGQLVNSVAMGALAQVVNTPGAIILGSTATGFTSNVGIGLYNPSYKVHVNGAVMASGSFVNLSDKRLKRELPPMVQALEKLMAVKGVSYSWKRDKAMQWGLTMDSLRHFGFVAQDLEKSFPEVVQTGSDSLRLKTVAYTALIPVLTQAIQEQQPFINALQQESSDLNNQVTLLQEAINELEKRAVSR